VTRRSLTLACAVLLWCGGSAPTSDATLPGRNGEIAYGIIDEIDSSKDIYYAGFYIGAVDPVSARQHRIGPSFGADGLDAIDPAFSPNGRLLAVMWQDDPGRGIVLIRPNGRPVRRLTRSHDRSPSWAPSGRRLAFDRQRCHPEATCDSLGIYTAAVNGSGRRRIVANGVAPTWSVRNEIAFVADRDLYQFNDSQGPIRVTDPAGKRIRTLTAQGASPDWSPRGDRLVFVRSRGSHSGLFIANADGSGVRRIHVVKGYPLLDSPVWSPDGQSIAFLRGDQLQTITPSGHARRKLRDIDYEYEGALSRVEHLDWQPLR
jgi:Tol biopolymer transport system component